MLPPVVASSSHLLWKSQPHEQQVPASSSNSSSPSADNLFLPGSRLDRQILTQALVRELQSCDVPVTSSSPKSLAKALGNCLTGCKGSDVQASPALLRALLLPEQQRLSGRFVQQQGESSNLSNAASSMVPSDQLKEWPESPMKSSSANSSNSSTSMAVSGDGGAAFLPQQQQQSEGNNKAVNHIASFVKLEEGHGLSSSSPSPARITASIALSAQASVGAGASKVSKRRSRASSKSPITVLSADTSNFRAMVQKLTGIPASSSPSASPNKFQFWDSPSVSILKPQPTRPTSHHTFHGGSLPTLDTSAPFLPGGDRSMSAFPLPARLVPSDNLLQAAFPSLPFLQFSQPQSDSSFSAAELGLNGSSASNRRSFSPVASTSDLKSLLQSNLGSAAASLPSLWDPADGDKFGEKIFNDRFRDTGFNDRSGEISRKQALYIPGATDQFSIRQVSNAEGFLMENDRQIMDPSSISYNSVDSWLSYDGTQSSKVELARNA